MRFVSYLRVSTDKQGEFGLGMDAQRDAVARHVRAADGEVVREYLEVESGRKVNRPQLAAAMAECRATRSVLVIAKLDRLARNVHFISGLLESGVDFVCCDMPQADKLTMHILAAVAEKEAELISARTRAGLAVAKARGTKMGAARPGFAVAEITRRGRESRTRLSMDHAARVAPYVQAARKAGASTLRELAEALTARGVATPSGRGVWTACAVSRVVAKMV